MRRSRSRPNTSALPPFFGWLQSALKPDCTPWPTSAAPLVTFGVFSASPWSSASTPFGDRATTRFPCSGYPSSSSAQALGLLGLQTGFWRGRVVVFIIGGLLLFAAPWAVSEAVVYVDRRGSCSTGPDQPGRRCPLPRAGRGLSAARRRPRMHDLHDGTQAQLVAAMRLGMWEESWPGISGESEDDLAQVRTMVTDAHRGTKKPGCASAARSRRRTRDALSLGHSQHRPDELQLLVDSGTPHQAIMPSVWLDARPAWQHAHASTSQRSPAPKRRWRLALSSLATTAGVSRAPSRIDLEQARPTLTTLGARRRMGALDIVSPQRDPAVVTLDLPLCRLG